MADTSKALSKNKLIVMRYVNEVQRGHSTETLGEIFSSDFADHSDMHGGEFNGGLEQLTKGIANILTAFPDLKVAVELLLEDGDKVVAYKHFTATHLGPWRGIPATGKPVEWKLASIYGIRDDKIAEYWGVIDDSGLNRALGLLTLDH